MLGNWLLPFCCAFFHCLPHFSLSSSCFPMFFSHLQYHSYSSQCWGCWHPPGRSGHHGHCPHIGRPTHWRHHTDHSCGLVPVSVLQTLFLSLLDTLFSLQDPLNPWVQKRQSSRILERKGNLGEYFNPWPINPKFHIINLGKQGGEEANDRGFTHQL